MITKERKLEILDKTIAHFRQQGVYAFEFEECKYRTPEGHKCAVGAWIPDELYRPDMEGVSVYNPPAPYISQSARKAQKAVHDALAAAGISGLELSFMKELQGRHDDSALGKLPFDEFLIDLGLFRDRIAAETTPQTL